MRIYNNDLQQPKNKNIHKRQGTVGIVFQLASLVRKNNTYTFTMQFLMTLYTIQITFLYIIIQPYWSRKLKLIHII